MTTLAIISAIVALTLMWAVPFERKRRAALGVFWSRDCLGAAWRKTFPDASRDDIREFLYLLVDAFGFKRSDALRFAPTDTVMGIYRAAYPDPSAPDALELETWQRSLQRRFGLATLDGIPSNPSLGALFAKVRAEWPNKALERSRGG
jgi:hypothetical protein